MKYVCAMLLVVTSCTGGMPAVAQITPVSLDSVHALGLDSITGAATAYFRTADQARGAALHTLLAAFLEFYGKEVGTDSRLRVAVLDSVDWGRVTRVPYGQPINSGPGSDNLLLAATSPPERIGTRAMPRGRNSDLLVIGHEGGHLLIWELMPDVLKQALRSSDDPAPDVLKRLQNVGAVPGWYWEMAANYLTTTFLEATDSEDARAWHDHLQENTEIPNPRFTHLTDWYASLLQATTSDGTPFVFTPDGGQNQGWFQGVVGLMAQHLHTHMGSSYVDYIRNVVSGGRVWSTEELVQQAELLAPGITTLLSTLNAQWKQPS